MSDPRPDELDDEAQDATRERDPQDLADRMDMDPDGITWDEE